MDAGSCLLQKFSVVIVETHIMKVYLQALCILSISAWVASVNYEILKLENCVTSNEEAIHVNFCVATPKRFNISVDVNKPLNKMFVSGSSQQNLFPLSIRSFTGQRRVLRQTGFGLPPDFQISTYGLVWFDVGDQK